MITQIPVSGFAAWCSAANTKPIVLDVREPWELQTASPREDGFTLLSIPMRDVPLRLGELNANHPIACLCHHGMRSLQVATYLVQNGFSEVVNLQGGIDAWSLAIDPTVPRY